MNWQPSSSAAERHQPTSQPEFWGGDILWTTSAYIEGLYLDQAAKYITSQGLEKSPSKLVPQGNLLIGTRAGVGKVAINSIDIAVSQDLTAVIIDVLSTIQRAKATQEDVIAAAQETKRSLMHRLFTYGPGAEPAPTKETEIGEIPAHWEMVLVGDVFAIKLGKMLSEAAC
jgi:restriction endonuclease S subunit